MSGWLCEACNTFIVVRSSRRKCPDGHRRPSPTNPPESSAGGDPTETPPDTSPLSPARTPSVTTPADELVNELAERVAEKVIAGIADALPPQAERWKLLSVDEVCELLGRSRRSVFAYIKFKRLPVVKLDDGSIRIDPDDLRQWCRDRRVPPLEQGQMTAEWPQTRKTPGKRSLSGRRRTTNPTKTGS